MHFPRKKKFFHPKSYKEIFCHFLKLCHTANNFFKGEAAKVYYVKDDRVLISLSEVRGKSHDSKYS